MLSSFCSVRAASLLSFLIGVGVDVSVAVAVRLLGAGADGVRRLLEDKAPSLRTGFAPPRRWRGCHDEDELTIRVIETRVDQIHQGEQGTQSLLFSLSPISCVT